MWKSESAHDEIDNIKFFNGNYRIIGLDSIEINVPNSPGIKV